VLALDDGEEVAALASRSRQASQETGGFRPESRADTRALVVAFGGIELELTGDAGAGARLGRAARGSSSAAEASADTPAPKFAACCRLQMIPPPAIAPEPPRSGLAWEWTPRGGELVTRLGGARIWQAPGRSESAAAQGTPRFEGMAWLASEARAPHHLLGGLAVMLSHRLGGSVFHAASVELDGAVIAFLGPSGAGKSTACRHVEGAPLVSVDRLILLPLGRTRPEEPRWFAHPLPGGTRPVPDMPGALARWRPLAALLRVQKAATGTAIVASAPALAVTRLRESAFQTGLSPGVERELLAALDDLAQHVPVARLELQLGASLRPLLRRWLKSHAEERG
jgi:hypothetical protein